MAKKQDGEGFSATKATVYGAGLATVGAGAIITCAINQEPEMPTKPEGLKVTDRSPADGTPIIVLGDQDTRPADYSEKFQDATQELIRRLAGDKKYLGMREADMEADLKGEVAKGLKAIPIYITHRDTEARHRDPREAHDAAIAMREVDVRVRVRQIMPLITHDIDYPANKDVREDALALQKDAGGREGQFFKRLKPLIEKQAELRARLDALTMKKDAEKIDPPMAQQQAAAVEELARAAELAKKRPYAVPLYLEEQRKLQPDIDKIRIIAEREQHDTKKTEDLIKEFAGYYAEYNKAIRPFEVAHNDTARQLACNNKARIIADQEFDKGVHLPPAVGPNP